MSYEEKHSPVFSCLCAVQDYLYFISTLEVQSLVTEYAWRQGQKRPIRKTEKYTFKKKKKR